MKQDSPSPTQIEALRKMIDTGGRLTRWDGGYWTFPGAAVKERGPGIGDVPEWYVGTQTVEAMERRGWLRRAGRIEKETPTRRDDRELTEAGRGALARHDAMVAFVQATEAVVDLRTDDSAEP